MCCLNFSHKAQCRPVLMKKTIRRNKNIIPCPSRENTQLSFVDSKDLNEGANLKSPLETQCQDCSTASQRWPFRDWAISGSRLCVTKHWHFPMPLIPWLSLQCYTSESWSVCLEAATFVSQDWRGLGKTKPDTQGPGISRDSRGLRTEDPHLFLPSFCSPFPSLSPPFFPFICFLSMHSFYPLSGQITREGNLSRRLLSLAYSFLIFLCFQRDHSQTHCMPLEKTRIF